MNKSRLLPRLGFVVWPSLSLAACAGYRGGSDSMGYIGDVAPAQPAAARTPFDVSHRPGQNVPHIEWHVSLNNGIRSHESQHHLYSIELSIDCR